MNKVGVETKVITETTSFKGKTQTEIDDLNRIAREQNEANGIVEIITTEEQE